MPSASLGAKKARALGGALDLLGALASAPGHRLSADDAARVSGCAASELPGLVERLATLSVRDTGARADIRLEGGFVIGGGEIGRIPPMRLDLEETAAMSRACSLMGLDPEALERIRAALFPLEGAEEAERPLLLSTERATPLLRRLSEAIAIGARLRLSYRGNADPAPRWRVVDPLALVSERGGTYLKAWDVEKGAERTYRLDRVGACEDTGGSVEAHPKATGGIAESLAGAPRVHLLFDDAQLAHTLGWAGLVGGHQTDGGYAVDVACGDERWLFDQLLAAVGSIRITGPQAVAERFGAYASRLRAELHSSR